MRLIKIEMAEIDVVLHVVDFVSVMINVWTFITFSTKKKKKKCLDFVECCRLSYISLGENIVI